MLLYISVDYTFIFYIMYYGNKLIIHVELEGLQVDK